MLFSHFNITKSKCIVSGPRLLKEDVVFHLNGCPLDTVDQVEILGCCFTSNCNASAHVDKRIQKGRQSFFNLIDTGMGYPGLDCNTKAYLWKTICVPSLVYGCESISLCTNDLKCLEVIQGNLLKQSLGLNRRSHHSSVLKAINVPTIRDLLTKHILSLYFRIFAVQSPARDLCTELLSMYISNGRLITGTLIHRVTSVGHSPVISAFIKNKFITVDHKAHEDGVVSSLRYLMCHENFMKPYSNEHILATLLTKSF